MDLSRTELYRAIKNPSVSCNALWNLCYDFVNSKKNINVCDNESRQNFLHVLCAHGGQLTKAVGVKVIYLIGSSGIHLDARDNVGDTCLHKAVRVPGSYRIIEALMRYRWKFVFITFTLATELLNLLFSTFVPWPLLVKIE
jgi:hypothetical protein